MISDWQGRWAAFTQPPTWPTEPQPPAPATALASAVDMAWDEAPP